LFWLLQRLYLADGLPFDELVVLLDGFEVVARRHVDLLLLEPVERLALQWVGQKIGSPIKSLAVLTFLQWW
jgi:hypothetical protein